MDSLNRVWCGVILTGSARVHTSRERQKGKNMLSNPKVSHLIVDPENTGRFLQIRGDAELTEEGAWNSSIRLHVSIQTTRAITVMSSRWKKKRETRIICRIHARRITLDAIH